MDVNELGYRSIVGNASLIPEFRDRLAGAAEQQLPSMESPGHGLFQGFAPMSTAAITAKRVTAAATIPGLSGEVLELTDGGLGKVNRMRIPGITKNQKQKHIDDFQMAAPQLLNYHRFDECAPASTPVCGFARLQFKCRVLMTVRCAAGWAPVGGLRFALRCSTANGRRRWWWYVYFAYTELSFSG